MATGTEASPQFLREEIVPPDAKCISPVELGPTAAVESFNSLDLGVGTPVDQRIAEAACTSCVHKYFCADLDQGQEFADAVAVEDATTIVGAEKVTAHPSARPRSALNVPVLRFDRTRMPDDPVEQLEQVIRPGVRSKQLLVGEIAAGSLTLMRDGFMARLQGTDPGAIARLTSVNALTRTQLHDAVDRIAGALFRQAHFVDYGVRGWANAAAYTPESFDLDRAFPAMLQIVEDTLQIKRQGHSVPQRAAMHHSPAYWDELATEFLSAGISAGTFMEVIRQRPTNPAAVFDEIVAKMQAPSPGGRSKAVVSATRALKQPSSESVRVRLEAAYEGHEYITPACVKRAFTRGMADPERALQAIVKRVERGKELYGSSNSNITLEDMVGVAEDYGDDAYLRGLTQCAQNVADLRDVPGMTAFLTEKDIHKYAQAYVKDVVTIMTRRKELFESLLLEADGSVTPGAIRDAVMNGIETLEEIKVFRKVKLLRAKFNRRKDVTRPVQGWMLEAVVLANDDEKVDGAAESLFHLLQDGILVEGVQERASQLPDDYYTAIEQARHYTGKYLTYASQLAALRPEDRVALARDTGIPLYPDIDDDKLAAALGAVDLATHVQEAVLPKCYELVRNEPNGAPLLLSQLGNDLRLFAEGRQPAIPPQQRGGLLTAKLLEKNTRRQDLLAQVGGDLLVLMQGREQRQALLSQFYANLSTFSQRRQEAPRQLAHEWQESHPEGFRQLDRNLRKLSAAYATEHGLDISGTISIVEQVLSRFSLHASTNVQSVDPRLQGWMQNMYRRFCGETKKTLKGDHGAGIFFALMGNERAQQPASSFAEVYGRLRTRFGGDGALPDVYDAFMRDLFSFTTWHQTLMEKRKALEQIVQDQQEVPWWDDAAWRPKANCLHLGADVNEFDLNNAGGERHVAQYCNPCTVRAQCLEYALQNQLPHLIYGGHTARQRRAILKKRGIDLITDEDDE